MNRRSKERRLIGWRYHGQPHLGATRPAGLRCPAVGPELADLSDGKAECPSRWVPPSRRRSSRAGRARSGRPPYRRATVAAARETFDLAIATSREARLVALAPEHQRRRLHYCEVDACWPT